MAEPPSAAHRTPPPRPEPIGNLAPYPLPDAGFEPSAEDEDMLGAFGLPVPGDAARAPAAAAFRRAFLQRPADGRPLQFMPLRRPALLGGLVIARPHAPPTAAKPAQKSLNWSGAHVVPRDGRSFVSVMANWTVPAVSRPAQGTAPEYRSSTWIGLDGQKFYRDSSLPQIGTLQRWIEGRAPKAVYSAWFQWWARGRDLPPDDLPLPVDADDEISAILTVLDDRTVRCNLKNVTRGIVLQAFDAFAPPGARISGATAEWIMERPSPLGSDGWGAYELPAFAPFAFTGGLAESRAPGRAEPREHALDGAKLMRMYAIATYPPSVRTIATASRAPPLGQALRLTYVPPEHTGPAAGDEPPERAGAETNP